MNVLELMSELTLQEIEIISGGFLGGFTDHFHVIPPDPGTCSCSPIDGPGKLIGIGDIIRFPTHIH